MFSQGEKPQETEEASSSDDSKSLRGPCMQNDSVDKPRILLVLEKMLPLDSKTALGLPAVAWWAELMPVE